MTADLCVKLMLALFVVLYLGVMCSTLPSQTAVSPTSDAGPGAATEQNVNGVQQPSGVDSVSLPDKFQAPSAASDNHVSPSGASQVSPSVASPATSGADDSAPVGTMSGEDGTAGVNIGNLPALDDRGVNVQGSPSAIEAGGKLWRLKPLAGVGYTYDDNIYISNTNRVGSGIYSITGGLTFELGDYLSHADNFLQFSYAGTGLFYTQTQQNNGYNQDEEFLAQYVWTKLSVQCENRFQYLNGPNRDVGTFTTGANLYDAIRFRYQSSLKTDLDLEFKQQSTLYQSNNNTYYQAINLGGNYQYSDKLSIGLEGVLAENTTEQSPNGYYQTLNARFHYDLTGKLALKATGGLQAVEYPSGGVPMQFVPVFSIGADYKPYENTSISLIGYRNENSSSFLNAQSYIATGFSLGITQTIHQHWTPGITFGSENDKYTANSSTVQATRMDNYFFFTPNITYSFLKNLQASVFYQFRNNISNQQQFTWIDNQFGIALKTSF